MFPRYSEHYDIISSLIAEALVTLDVHGKDVITELFNQGVSHSTDFKWLSQMRYYWTVNIHL